jgi:phosphatidylserine decarboxylase
MAERSRNNPPIKSLKALYANDEGFRATMDLAFANVHDPETHATARWPNPLVVNPWKGKDFADLLAFFDDWYHLLPTPSGEHDEFHYIEKFAWFYYKNQYGQQIVGQDPGLGWTRDFAEARRRFLDSQASTAVLPQWLADPTIHIEQCIIPAEGFKSFNEFFIRELKPGTRPIASPVDDSVLVAPTDCVLNMIDLLTPETVIPTKLNQQLHLEELLAGSAYAKRFAAGTAISCVLSPTTYHHYHAVVSGKVVESREDVAGAYWGMEDFGSFFNAGNLGCGHGYSAFEHSRRGYLVIETKEHGLVAMVPVGLDTIGSVVFEERFKKVTPQNQVPVYKGEKLGHFAYGGSLIIILIEQGISSITIPQGQQIGVFAHRKS